MRLLKTEITPLSNELMRIDLRDQPFFWSPFHTQPTFHAHPELELTLIEEGFGKRVIGNKVEPFEAGDMVFVGSNVSHVWLSDPVFYKQDSALQSKAIVAYFNPQFLQLFDAVKEFHDIHEMIQQSSRGIRIFGETRNTIAKMLKQISTKQGFEKVEGLLKIMNLIATTTERSYIINDETEQHDELYPDRLIDVIKYTKDHLHEPITLHQVAGIACMTEQSFCRFFKKRVKKSFSQFLSDLRIGHARELLVQTDRSIKDIAGLCGYNSISHFCRIFKEHTGKSPLQYKSGLSVPLLAG